MKQNNEANNEVNRGERKKKRGGRKGETRNKQDGPAKLLFIMHARGKQKNAVNLSELLERKGRS